MPMMFSFLLLAAQVPAGGTPVVLPDSLVLQGNASCGTVQPVAVSGQPFRRAVRVTTTKIPPNEWEFEVGTDATVAIKKGDVLLATVYVRAIKGQAETGEGRTTMDFQVKGGDWSKSVSHPIPITKEWRRIDVPFVSGYDTPARGANVAFRLGYGLQSVEIGGLSIVNFERRVALKDLPRTAITYRGQEANAPWRKAALARIERIRKGNLAIRVTDAKGRPIPNARVEVAMTKHAFPFGTAVAADALFVQGSDGDRFRQTLLADFNRATIENHLKWPMWVQDWGRRDGLRAVDWLHDNGLTIRAHNVVWPSWRNSPPGLDKLSAPELRKEVDEHIDDVVRAVKGKVDLWDVVNEPYDNHDILDKLGGNPMPDWFRRVKRIDPKPTLVLNDYPPLDGAAKENAHLNSFYQNLSRLKASGAPLEGIGFQCHVGGDPISPERVLSGLDRFAKLGLPIEITEFDINTQDREFQKRYMRDFMIAMFSHPSVTGFTQWGFWANRHWLPDSALYASDWTLRPHGKAYLDLVKGEWWTKAKGQTGREGFYRTRGFLGTYEVKVSAPGKATKTVRVNLAKGGATTVVRL